MARFIVTTEEDRTDANDGLFSLREAIAAAAGSDGADRIEFARDVRNVRLDGTLVLSDPDRVRIDGDRNGDGLADVSIGGAVAGSLLRIGAGADADLRSLHFGDAVISAPFRPDGVPGRAGNDAEVTSTNADGSFRYLVPGAGGSGGAGQSDGQGVAAIVNQGALRLSRVSFDEIEAFGADGGDGGTGGIGGGSVSWSGRAGDGLPGRNGTSGASGGAGGRGGEGGDAAAAVINDGSLVLRDVGLGSGRIAAAGDGGDGGAGGRGGDGGNGLAGGNGGFSATPQNGGNGGAAGNGATGGAGGVGGSASDGFLNRGEVVARTAIGAAAVEDGGSAGAGGAGGAGGSAGGRGRAGAGGESDFFLVPGGSAGSTGAAGASGPTGAAAGPGWHDGVWLADAGAEMPETFDTLLFAHAGDRKVREGGAFDFSIGRLGSDDSNFVVSWEIDFGRGVGRSDFAQGEALSGEVEFTAGGPDVRSLAIETARDGLTEGAETFRFRLVDVEFTGATGAEVGFGTDAVKATIRDRNGPSRGDDALKGTPLDDRITGKSGDDAIRGAGGDDTLIGSGGRDRLFGGGGEDELRGGVAADRLFGGKGDDVLVGQKGADVMKGGGGNDVFVFTSLDEMGRNAQRDVIRDFEPGRDFIDLTLIDANLARGGDQDFGFIGNDGFSERPGELRYAGGVLRGDVDGDGRADFDIEIANGARVTEDDFLMPL